MGRTKTDPIFLDKDRVSKEKRETYKDISIETLKNVMDYTSPDTTRQVLTGNKQIKYEKAKLLADYFGVRAEYLIGKDDYRTIDDYMTVLMKRKDNEMKVVYLLLASMKYKITRWCTNDGVILFDITTPSGNKKTIFLENMESLANIIKLHTEVTVNSFLDLNITP